MRTGHYEFYGKSYLIVFSARVNAAMEAEGIRFEDLQTSHAPVSSIVKILSFMIDAGDRYAKLNGIENPGTVSYDLLLDGLGMEEMDKIPGQIASVISGERNVEAEPPKNAGAPS